MRVKWPKLYHPLWVHLPAVLAVAGTVGYLRLSDVELTRGMRMFMLPGLPTMPTTASARDMVGVVMGGLVPLGFFSVVDELWARQEGPKRYNWMSLMDEMCVGLFVGLALGRVAWQGYTGPEWVCSLGLPALAVALLVGAAALLELVRPCRPLEADGQTEVTVADPSKLTASITSKDRWVYWQSQDPIWMKVFALPVAAFLIFCAVVLGEHSLYLRLHFSAHALLCVFIVGLLWGMRVTVTPEALRIHIGMFGRRALSLQIDDLETVTVRKFRPLPEFHSFYQVGLKRRGGVRPYYFRGNEAVQIRSRDGSEYLIGSDDAEQLEGVLTAAMEARHSQDR